LRSKQPDVLHFFFLVKGPAMEPKDYLSFEIRGIKASAHGKFAIVCLLLTFLVAGAGYLSGRTLGLW
jgi:hypothetical protein